MMAVVMAVLAACNAKPDLVDSGTLTDAQRTFSAIETSILLPKCAVCHSVGDAKGGVVVTSYEDLMVSPGAVVPFAPYQSQLFKQCYSHKMPRDAAPLSSLELRMIYDWIAYGAQNN